MRPLFDAHLDLSWNAVQWSRDLTLSLAELNAAEAAMHDHPARGRATVSLPEMRRANLVVCLATLLARSKPNVRPSEGIDRRSVDYTHASMAHAAAVGQLAYYRLMERLGEMRMIRTAAELKDHLRLSSEGSRRIGYILAMEGADPITTPDEARWWWERGLRCVGLAHYGPHPYAAGTGATGPVTDAGRKLLKAFEEVGMILDLTHTAEPGFFEALDLYPGPVHASHNLCRALVPADRQFSDEQIRQLVERDAVIGMACDAWMLHPGWVIGQTSREVVKIDAIADHIDHICQLAGDCLHVGIGSDLDGGYGTEQCPTGLETIADLHRLAPILARRGYTDADLDAFFWRNWARFFERSLPHA